VILQGSKVVGFGDETLGYNTNEYLLSSAHLPANMKIIEASKEKLNVKELARSIDISSVAFEVGYESPSQFSREFARMYGSSPSAFTKHDK
jgi:AraC-like DNA-binding protein